MTLPTPGADLARDALSRVARLADPARTRRLHALRRLWRGVPEDGLASFWDATVPLSERAPCVSASLPEGAGGRLVALVFGEGRFPTLSLRARDPYGRAWPEGAAALLDALAVETIDAAKLRTAMPEGLTEGLKVGTLVMLAAIRRGRPCVEILPAEYCTAERDADGEVAALEMRYRYPGQVEGRDAHLWFRRRIDATADTTFRPVEARDDGHEPAWTPDETRTAVHALGFCPVLWHRNRPDPGDLDGEDGRALFDGLEDELHALDMSMSQHHRAGRYNGDPQMWADDADEDDQGALRGDAGRAAHAPLPGFSWFNSIVRGASKPTGGAALQRSPTKVWHIAKGSSLNLAESSGAGASILREDTRQLRQAILDARGIVMTTPGDLGANASAKLLREVHAAMVAVAGLYREEYGALLCGLVDLLLRVALTVRARGGGVYVAGLDAARDLLAQGYVTIEGGERVWVGLPWSLSWGDYFEPTWGDVTSAVQAASQALQAGVVTVDEARKLLAPVLGIDAASAAASHLAGELAARSEATRSMLTGLGAPDAD